MTQFYKKFNEMRNIKLISAKRNVLLSAVLVLGLNCLKGQKETLTIVEETNTIKLLSVRPYLTFGVAPITGDFASDLRIDAQYWYKDKFDVRLGSSGGTFTGVNIGGTYHLRDNYVTKSQKFIVSETQTGRTRTTTYYKSSASIRKVFGPAADVRIGYILSSSKVKTMYTELNLGIDYQIFSRNYADSKDNRYPSNKNGWYSVKFQGVLAFGTSQLGVGAVGVMGASRKPWKGVTMHLNLAMGAIKYFGGKVNPIISPGFGLSVNLIKSKDKK